MPDLPDLQTGPFFGHGLQYQSKFSAMQAQAYNHALQWLAKQNPAPDPAPTHETIESNEYCTCAAKYGVIGHASFCPLGDGTGPETAPEGQDDRI